MGLWAGCTFPLKHFDCLIARGCFWEVLGKDFGGIWEARGAQLETKIDEFRVHFPTPSQETPRAGFGEGPGWIGEGFWEGFVRIGEDLKTILNGIWNGFRLNFRRISD